MITSAYCDGGVIGPNPSERGGTFAWCHVDVDGKVVASNKGVVLPAKYNLPKITNNISELVAALHCIYALPEGWSGTFYSDSQVTLGRIFWGWAMNDVPEVLVKRSRGAAAYLGKVRAILLDGHPTRAQLANGRGKRGNMVSVHNVWCDKACGEARKEWEQRN